MAIHKVKFNGHEVYMKEREYLRYLGIRIGICIIILIIMGILY